MEEGPDCEPTINVKFIATIAEIFPSNEVALPDTHCNLVTVSPKYGLVFVACGTLIKVFTTKALTEDKEKTPLTTINTGASITHVAASCDGLTLLVAIIHSGLPHALFYEIRNIVSGCEEQTPFVSVGVSYVGGARIHGLAWNPVDPNSVAVAASPSSLMTITLRDTKVDVKTEIVPARAVGWSPKGKQLTVGLADGSLRLFKPDLTGVRNVVRPPKDGIGSVLSITWFTNTEFFISYKLGTEEEDHVMMYVNAPKAKEPRFVTYDYLCNYNKGPRPAMFYPAFFPEWSLLCVLSSRAIQVAVLGKPGAREGWCEYEIEEGGCAEVHVLSHREETFPLGLAVDFTSQKIFINKDKTTTGPHPVIYTLSTGGELNIFHLVNSKPGVEQLTKPLENMSTSGHRNAHQYNGASSYTVPKPGGLPPPVFSPFPVAGIPAFTSGTSAVASNILVPPAAPTATGPLSGSPFSLPSAGLFKSSTSENQGGTGAGLQLPTLLQQAPTETAKPNFSFNLPSTSPFTATASLPSTSGIVSSSPAFVGMKGLPAKPSIPPQPQQLPVSLPGMQTSSTGTPPSSSLGDTKFRVNLTPTPQKPESINSQGLKFPTYQLPQANTAAGSISQGKPALNSMSSTPFKTTSHMPVTQDISRQVDSQGSIKSQSTAPAARPVSSLNNTDSSLLSTIASATNQFEEDLKDHIHSNGFSSKIANKEEMGDIRRSLSEVCEWTELMDSTTSELKGEVSQLHSEVLEGYTLAEEAKVHMSKNKNPRYNLVPQSRPLDPHSRRQLDDIRSLYQYLQSQLVEVETRLHLDWAAFNNDKNKKKKHELPASETLYQALKKCHNLRRVCERRVDVVCDRIKTLNLNFLSSLSTSHCHYDEEETLASLEKSLRETTITPKVPCSPFKMLSPEKQKKLERVLAQRQIIPLRKCSSAPKADLTSVDNLFSSVCSQEGSPDSVSPTVQHTFSFGPETFSTPNRIDKNVSATIKASFSGSDDPAQDVPCSSWEVSGDNTSTMSGLAGNESSSLSFATSSFATKVLGNVQTTKPQYEDITPPQTPDNKLETGLKTASPLLALSSLVSKVPTTTVAEAKVSAGVSLTDSKPVLGDSTNMIPVGGIKTQIIMASVPAMTNFTFKPVTSAPSLTVGSVESSVPFSFTPFVPPSSTSFTVTEGTSVSFNNQTKAQSQATSSGLIFKAPAGGTVSVVSTGTSQPSINPAGFSFKPPASIISTYTSFSASDNLNQSSKFGSQAEAVDGSSVPIQASIPFINQGLPTSASGASFPQTSDAIVVAESDTSSSSGESDTASNNTVVADNASFSGGASDSTEGQESQIVSGETDFLSSACRPLAPNNESTGELSQGLALNTLLKKTSESELPKFSSGSSSLLSQKPSTSTLPSSIFNSSAAPVSLFGSGKPGSAAGVTTTSGNLFGGNSSTFSLPSSAGSPFGTPTTTTTTAGSIFGTSTTSATSESIFGTTTATTSTTATTTGGIFAPTTTMSTTGGLFGTTGNLFVATTPSTTSSAFVTTSNTSATSSLFGTATTTASSGNIFGTASSSTAATLFGTVSASSTTESLSGTTTTTSESTFGATTTKSGSPFGSTTTTSGSLFGSTTTSDNLFTSTTTSGSIFGSTSTTTASIFGTKAAGEGNNAIENTSTPKSLFGGQSNTSVSIFSSKSTLVRNNSDAPIQASSPITSNTGVTAAAATVTSPSYSMSFPTGTISVSSSAPPTSSIFGGTMSSTGSTSGLFNAAATTTPSSTFGQSSSFTALTTSSSGSAFSSLSSPSAGFGTPATTTTASATPVFGQTASQNTGSVFSQGVQNSQGSVFATPATTSSLFNSGGQSGGSVFSDAGQGGSVFGGPTSNPGIFGGPTSTSSTSSVFGHSGSSSGFSSGAGGSVFGQTSTAASPFSSSSTTKPETSPFGSANFGTGGGFFSGLGSKPSGDSADKNVFGSTAPTDNKPQSNLFGGGTNTSPFGSSVFGGGGDNGNGSNSGTFSTGGGTVSQSGFAVAAQQSSSVFGGSSTFGGGANLGSSPAFGGNPTFGSPNKMGSSTFGGNPAFSSPLAASPGSGGFSSFGSQAASTFGAVANSAPAAAAPSTSGFSSFASQNNTASFGGLAQQQSTNQQQQQGGPFGQGGNNMFGSGTSFSSWR